MDSKIKNILTIDFLYLLFLLLIVPLVLGSKNILDVLYFLLITCCYIKLKLYNKKNV